MRNRVSAFRARLLGQAAAVAVLAGFGAACSADAMRVKEPIFTGSTANQRAIIGNAQAASGGTAVAQADLPPPPGTNGPVNLAASSPGGAWSAVGGRVVTVGPGESLDTLAIKYGVPSSEIARANGISSPSQLTQGRAIVIPRRSEVAYAPAVESTPVSAPAPATASRPSGDIHVVEPGQTLYGIARIYGVSVGDIVALNSLSSESLQVGQRLKIPAGGATTAPTRMASLKTGAGTSPKPLGTLTVNADGTPAPPVNAAPTTRVASAPAVSDVPAVPVVPVSVNPTPGPANANQAADPPSANGTTFRWPVRGRIISGFGPMANGERNDGINLAVPEGTSVKAAEAGTVIYAGNELAGYGNLILVRHADGWVSAYAHNEEIDVKRGDSVQRGQIIAKAGATGSVSSPQLHFELRKGAKPVNPMDYLSSTG
jgi:murein DD-endopeptidase MepM/ murein hydrolase activator NlpD